MSFFLNLFFALFPSFYSRLWFALSELFSMMPDIVMVFFFPKVRLLFFFPRYSSCAHFAVFILLMLHYHTSKMHYVVLLPLFPLF